MLLLQGLPALSSDKPILGDIHFELNRKQSRMLDSLLNNPDRIRAVSGTSIKTLPPHTEIFISQRHQVGEGQYALYGEVHTGPHDGEKVWLPYHSYAPEGKLFTSDLKDKLLYSSNNINETYYYFTTETIPVVRDDAWWLNTIDQLNQPERTCVMQHKFKDLEEKLTATQRESPVKATDVNKPCPSPPQNKEGKPCSKRQRMDLNPKLISYVEESAERYGINPAMLAAMIQMESLWDPFIENGYEKKRCKEKASDGNCSDYRWSKGLGQFGRNIAADYGLDWDDDNGNFSRPEKCGTSRRQVYTSECIVALEEACRPYIERETLVPISCPQAMIEATAKHLKDAFPEEMLVWVRDNDGDLDLQDVIPAVTSSEGDAIRAQISYFQRGVRVFNSYVEHYEQNGKWPDSYGEAWATPRLNEGKREAPSVDVGYQMLTNEFVNRCHIWGLAGLCGEIPEDSLVGQYMQVFDND